MDFIREEITKINRALNADPARVSHFEEGALGYFFSGRRERVGTR